MALATVFVVALGIVMALTAPMATARPPGDSCHDTDGGINVLVKGTASGYFDEKHYSYTDYCVGNFTVKEYFCLGNMLEYMQINCTQGYNQCYNGRCV